MTAPSMLEAAKIRDVAKRHAYVFDNGLCSPDFFDVDKRMASEEFGLLRERIGELDDVLEIGCFTGLNLIGLRRIGKRGLMRGIDFVKGALKWLGENEPSIARLHGTFPDVGNCWDVDRIICFDVLEHQQNVGAFLEAIVPLLQAGGRVFFLVPAEKQFYDCGHVAFFPDAECLRNVLDYVFEVEEIFELKTCRKLFAACRKRN